MVLRTVTPYVEVTFLIGSGFLFLTIGTREVVGAMEYYEWLTITPLPHQNITHLKSVS
jgi:hypothetical protein